MVQFWHLQFVCRVSMLGFSNLVRLLNIQCILFCIWAVNAWDILCIGFNIIEKERKIMYTVLYGTYRFA